MKPNLGCRLDAWQWLVVLAVFAVLVVGCRTVPPPQPVGATLSVIVAGSGSGTVTSDPEGIDTDDGGFTATFEVGTVITLTADADAGSTFTGFTGATCEEGSSDTTCILTLTESGIITATFALEPIDVLDIVADVGIAGAQLTLLVSPDVESVEVESLRPETTIRVAVDGDRLRLAWVGAQAEEGGQLRVRFTPALEVAPHKEAAVVLAEAGGADLGLNVLEVSIDLLGSTHASPLVLDAFAFGSLTLDPSWIERPLGDLDDSGVLDIGDVLRLVEVTRSGVASDRVLYHADLTLDDVVDTADLELALERLVDPGLPARLHVRPRAVPFVALDSERGGEAWVLIANAGRAPFENVSVVPPAGVEIAPSDGVVGQLALALDLPLSARRGWRPGSLAIIGAGETASVRLGHVVVLVAGQSNATGLGSPLVGWPEVASSSVRVLGNDYRWRDLLEPMDDASGQLDTVSADNNVAYSLGTRLGFSLWNATGFESYLVPSTRNGSKVVWWQPEANRLLDRTTLFGSTNFRAQVSAGLLSNPNGEQPHGSEGGPVTALVWYQGESDASDRSFFQLGTNAIMDEFAEQLGVPVIYVQLASDWFEQTNLQHHALAELQRRMESTWGALGQRRQAYHMVVTFDLPRSDSIHLSAFGQRVLAERVALAVREHVLGEDVDGTGPRLNRDRVAWSGNQVWVQTTHVVSATPLDTGYFTVFDGPPTGSLDDVQNYGANAIPILYAERDPGDPTAVRLTLERTPVQAPYVRYMALPNVGPSTRSPSAPETWEVMAPGVVVAAEGGLPLPVFGPLAAVAWP